MNQRCLADIPLQLWRGVAAAQDTELSSSASAHRIGQKSLFPILKSWVSCWSRTLRIPPANKYLKKNLFMLFLCCRQIPVSHSLPMFTHLRNIGSLKWIFFGCPVMLIWHFCYFWAAQVIVGLSRIRIELLAGKAAFPGILSIPFLPQGNWRCLFRRCPKPAELGQT